MRVATVTLRLQELSVLADSFIEKAESEYKLNRTARNKIFLKYNDLLFEKLGQGSIGPVTAAAGPLLNKKQEELAAKLDFDLTGFLSGLYKLE